MDPYGPPSAKRGELFGRYEPLALVVALGVFRLELFMREREEYIYRAPVEAAQQRQLRHPRLEYLVDVDHADGPVIVVDDDERRDLPLFDDAHRFDR